MKIYRSCVPINKRKYFGEELPTSVLAFQNLTLWNIDLEDDVDLILHKDAHNTLLLLLLIYLTVPIITPHVLVGFLDQWPSK